MIRSAFLHALNTVEAVAVITVGACTLLRGFILEQPQRPKRDPFTGQPETGPN